MKELTQDWQGNTKPEHNRKPNWTNGCLYNLQQSWWDIYAAQMHTEDSPGYISGQKNKPQ